MTDKEGEGREHDGKKVTDIGEGMGRVEWDERVAKEEKLTIGL